VSSSFLTLGRIALLFVLGVFLSACGIRAGLQLEIPSSKTAVTSSEKEQLLGSIKNQSLPFSLRALYSSEISAMGKREELTQALSFQRPDKLRLEVFTPAVNQLLFIAIANGGEFLALDLQERVLLKSHSSKKVLSRLLNLPLTAEELMHWGSATVFPGIRQCRNPDVYKLEQGEILILCRYAARELRLRFDSGLLLREFSLAGEDLEGLSTSYDYTDSRALASINFKTPDIEGVLRVRKLEKEMDLSHLPMLFNLSVPSGFREENFED